MLEIPYRIMGERHGRGLASAKKGKGIRMQAIQMKSAMRVLLIGYQDQDNLGLRYLMSSVNQSGHHASIMTYGSNPLLILDTIQKEKPDVIGFSLIFQYMTPDFATVIRVLRNRGVRAHITIGGHYSSFEPAEVLEAIPELDSVIRFEGEVILLNLLNSLASEEDWRTIPGIAYHANNGNVTVMPLAKPIEDLDNLPYPDRRSIDYENHPMPTASILASRGCPWDCSFCCIRPFYEQQGGKIRRLRKPSAVVKEIIELYQSRGVSVFLFQDDDFLAGGKAAKRWAIEIANYISEAGLSKKIAFKISCRSDEIDEETIARLMSGGLSHVYMGVESGDEQGLINMNKHLKPEAHLKAGQILKHLGLSFDFGFMLLEPYSTFESIRNNIHFLDTFIGDGWSVAPFCRMLPYAGTPIKKRLQKEGRLRGTPYEPSYQFLDPKIDLFYSWMVETFYERNFTNQGLCHILRGLIFEAHLRLSEHNHINDSQRAYIHYLTAVCNRVASYSLLSAINYVEATPLEELNENKRYLTGIKEHEKKQEQRILKEVSRYYKWVHKDFSLVTGPATTFENSWTFNDLDREATGIVAA